MEFSPEQLSQLQQAFGPMMAGLIFIGIILSKLADILKIFAINKLNGRLGGTHPEEMARLLSALIAEQLPEFPSYPVCHADPQHFERIKDIQRKMKRTHELQEKQDDMINSGDFSSPWSEVQVDRIMETCKKLDGKA